ncbi:MAG: hypothetical protein M0019_07145 [Actinomycetota bacterium]|nr:hypothetical protein [Actinomycetota bacterium]
MLSNYEDIEETEGSATFVYDFAYLEAKLDYVDKAVEANIEQLIGAAVVAGDGLVTKVGPRSLPKKTVEVQVGEVRRVRGSILIPICWAPISASYMFPRLEGELEFTESDPGNVRISLRGSYRAPLGLLGEHMDRMVMHRMAESTVRNFLGRVVDRFSKLGTD